jgi:diacylglycerol kinase family enzyme
MVRRVWLITVSNSKNYALLPLATDASVTDGLLNVGIFQGSTWHHYLRQMLSVLIRRQNYHPDVDFIATKRVTIQSTPPLPVHVDAEPLGMTPMTFEVVPQALTIIVPRESAPLLSEPLPS